MKKGGCRWDTEQKGFVSMLLRILWRLWEAVDSNTSTPNARRPASTLFFHANGRKKRATFHARASVGIATSWSID